MEQQKNILEWSDIFSVGNDKIDIQHKRILNYINLLSSPPYNSVRNEEFHELLAEISEYALFHIKYEEELLRQLNYPDYEEHKKEHDNLIENATLFSLNAESHEIETPEQLRAFLISWWEDHILVQDMKFKPFLL